MVAAATGNLAREQERFYQCSTYNNQGKHGCYRNIFRESNAREFLVPKIQQGALAPANFVRHKTAVRRQITARKRQTPGNVTKLRAKLMKVEADLKDASRELKRVPDDLYDAAIADYRESQVEQTRLETALEAAQDHDSRPSGDVDTMIDLALGGIPTLQQKFGSADGRIARGALQAIIDRIDLEFEHVRGPNLVRSLFRRGIVKFKSSNLVSAVCPCPRRSSERQKTM